MDLEVKLFNPAASYARPSRSPRRTTSRFAYWSPATERNEPMLTSDILIGYRQKEWRG